MSHLVPVRDYSGSPDPIAAIHAARLERQRRIAAAAYVSPAPAPASKSIVAAKAVVSVEEVIARYRLAVDTFDPVIDMSGVVAVKPPRPAWPAVIAIVSRETGVRRSDLESRRRFKRIAHARQLAFWLMREGTKHSLPVIGRIAGDYDHTTVLHGCSQVERRRIDDPKFRKGTAELREELIGLLA